MPEPQVWVAQNSLVAKNIQFGSKAPNFLVPVNPDFAGFKDQSGSGTEDAKNEGDENFEDFREASRFMRKGVQASKQIAFSLVVSILN